MPDKDSENSTKKYIEAYIRAQIAKKYLESVPKKTAGKRRKTARRLRKNNKTKRRR